MLLICLSPFLVFTLSGLSENLYWSFFAPEILQDFHKAKAGNDNILISANYHGQHMNAFTAMLAENGFECKIDQLALSCRFLTDTIIDAIYWIVDAQADETKHIIQYRGHIHSTF